MLDPTEEKAIKPEPCSCGNRGFPETETYCFEERITIDYGKVRFMFYQEGKAVLCAAG